MDVTPTWANAMLFQFTPLREGRPVRQRMERMVRLIFQFTPLREGRQQNHTKSIVIFPQ